MTGRAVAAALVGSVMLAAVGAAWADPAPPRLTADQAILIARDYCKSIGQPVTEVGTATFPAPAKPRHDPPEPDRYWLPRWVVDFPRQATVEVVDETGAVNYYENQIWQFNLSPPPTDGPEITAAQAGQIATDALRKTGQPMSDLVLAAVERDTDDPARSPDLIWGVRFERVYHGLSYEGQGIGVSVEYRGGRVDGFAINYPSPPAVPSPMNFDAGRAAQKALERLAQRGVKTALIYSEDAEYVVPDDPLTNGLPRTEFVAPRLAWVAHAGTGGYPVKESVDAETGDVISEETYVLAGPVTLPKGIKTAAQILADAKEVKIERRTAKYEWPKKPAAVLSDTSQPDMFKLLRSSEPSSIKDLMVAPEFQLLVTTSAAWTTMLYYLPDRNLVGDGVNWLAAPAGFKTWMEKLGGKTK
ncbi:MAG TPA: hypothetical protein VFJ58_00765 [Armatimonadota bacterium]|nr:hypothetical protein [Armatimonadota bacterium]